MVAGGQHECPGRHWEYVPVQCEGVPACVRYADTREMHVIEARPNGVLRAMQVISVDCNTPTFRIRMMREGVRLSEHTRVFDPC